MQTTPVDRPRFRQDLVAEPIEDGGARFIDVLDPDSGVLYRFFEVEYSLACAMDGERDVAGIVKWADEELGLKTNAKEVGHVVSTLGGLGFIEAGAGTAAAAAAAARAKTPTPMDISKVEAPSAGRWDQPTAMGTADEYLQKGVVHGAAKAVTPAPDVELGRPGTRPSQPDALPRAPELELGAPGMAAAATSARGAAPAKVDEIPLGKPGKSESVETDLAADMPLSAAAVKEAVRQSQIMKAVDVPPEIAAEVNKPAPAAKVEAKPAAKVEAKPVEAKPVEKPVERPVEKPAQKPAERPAERPAPPVEAHAETRPPAAAPAVSPMLIAALVLVLLGLGGFALWKFVLKKKDPAPTTGQTQPTQPTPPPEPPAAPPVETAKLATEQPPADEIKPVAAGQIATIVGSDTALKEGDPIARLVGFKPVEAQVVTAEKAIAKARDAMAAAEKERDAAQTAGNKNGVAAAEKKIAAAQKTLGEQEPKLATAKAALDKFLIKAPASGKVNTVAKANAKVTPTDVIATLTRDPVLVATFKSAGEVTAGARVLLAPTAGGQPLSCTVAQSGGDGVKIACPKDAAAEGTEVKYAGVDPNAPAADAPPAGSAAPTAPPAAPTDAPKPDEPKPDEAKPEEPKVEKKVEKRRPRPRPRPAADKPAGEGEETPPPPPPADPAPPAGSGS